MSDPILRITPSTVPAPAGSGRWITAKVAADRSKLGVGHINRLCLETWSAMGLARRDRLDSGQVGWLIDEAADSRFAAGKSAEQLAEEFDWLSLPSGPREVARFRFDLIKEWYKAREDGLNQFGLSVAEATQRFLMRKASAGVHVAEKSLRRWDAQLRTARTPAVLVDARKVKDKEESGFVKFYELLENWYLRQGEPSVSACYKLARAEARRAEADGESIPVPCLRQARRHLDGLAIAKKTYARLGPKAFDDQCAAYCKRDYTRIVVEEHGQRVERAMRSNDIWDADHHPCDTLVEYQGKIIRPWLTAWQDLRSRKIVGYRFSATDPNSSTILLALRDAVKRTGLALPAFIYTDNGKDFDAWLWDGRTKRERRLRIANDVPEFKGVYGILGIKHLHAKPYNAKAKPIERWFRTFEGQFGVFTPTYCGRDSVHKPEQLADLVTPEKVKAGKVMKFEDYVREATAYIEDVFHRSECDGHGMEGHSPNDIYAACLDTINTTTEAALDICLMKATKPLSIGRNGIRFNYREYGQHDPALRQLGRQKVILRYDPNDISWATVWTLNGERITTVQCNDLSVYDTTSEAAFGEKVKEMNRHNRQLKEVSKRGLRKVQSPTELFVEDAIAAERARHESTPPPEPNQPHTKIVRTGFEHLSPDVKPRRAVGADAVASSTLLDYAEED